MAGNWKAKHLRRNFSQELMEIVHAEGYHGATFREVRHMLNVPKDQVPALQDALATLLEDGKLRLGSRDRIVPIVAQGKNRTTKREARDVETRSRRKAERHEEFESSGERETPPPQRSRRSRTEEDSPAAPLPREGEGWSNRYSGPSWKKIVQLFSEAQELPGPFTKAVLGQAAEYQEPGEKEFAGRVDCRQDDVCTIDPFDAHDHDDAVAVVETPKGWRLDVHIADVSHYIPEGSALDKAAVKRSFTTYLPWTAVTMLPGNLAADLCSLLDGKDRLALSCRMDISRDGNILGFQFFESVVRVRRFLAYEKAQELADRGDPSLSLLKDCADALLACRRKESLLEFDLPEPRIVFDRNGEPCDAKVQERMPSHRWIEEAMLAANRCCARLLDEAMLPGLHRVHEPPEDESLANVSSWARLLGLPAWKPSKSDSELPTNVRPAAQQWLSELLSDGKIPVPLQTKVVRSMKKARYSADCMGHFALGWTHYAHYTSPIRRYADLWTHRVIKAHLRKEDVPARWAPNARRLATHVSGREDAVVKSERSANKCCAAWILRERVGDLFEARITGCEPIGVFVQVENPWAEGMMHVKRMRDDFWEFNEQRSELVGRRSGRVLRVGDKVTVRLAQADPVNGWVDFEPGDLPQEMPNPAPRPGATRNWAQDDRPSRYGNRDGFRPGDHGEPGYRQGFHGAHDERAPRSASKSFSRPGSGRPSQGGQGRPPRSSGRGGSSGGRHGR
ncbi:MAG: RNB domain-containing ribonuclease [Fibrobacteria bacterium]|nr:RNB domain-containing ribonuclease [Fibrobacteria bacterium]